MRQPALLVAISLGALGCDDECKSLPPTFELDVRAPVGAASLEVVVELGGQQHSRIFDVGGALDDGETSLVVELQPDVTASFELEIAVVAYSDLGAQGSVVMSAQDRFDGSPDGCNRFEMQLGAPPPDAGVPDAGQTNCCGPDCDLCELTCDNSEVCNLDCAGTAECQVHCSGGSACEALCANTGECASRCNGGANCRLDCGNAAECKFDVGAGIEEICTDGSIVCNRPCP